MPGPGNQLIAVHRDRYAIGNAKSFIQLRSRPKPLVGSAEQIRVWVELATGGELDSSGVVKPLSPAEWLRRRDRLRELGGEPGH